MTRQKILWLCSWYPGKTEPFNGDFIQRHARAAALYNDIHVIHVTGDTTGQVKKVEREDHTFPGLTESIIYFEKKTSLWGRLAAHFRWQWLFRQAVRQYIVQHGKPDLVHVQVPMRAGLVALWIKRNYKIPFVVSEHWGIYNEVERLNYGGRSITFKKITQRIFKQAAKFISVSHYLAKGVNKLVMPKEYVLIPNVVDTDLFYFTEKKSPIFRFIHVSNMVPLKNAEGIVRAFALLLNKNADAELVMVGDTDPAIRQYAEKTGIPSNNISFRGEVMYTQVAKEMQEADCFILNSNIENSPCVIGESLCCGVPVIATRVGGVPELVNESNAILIEPGQDDQLAAAMLQMIQDYSGYDRQKIAEAATAKFSYPEVGKQFDAVYRSVEKIKPKKEKQA